MACAAMGSADQRTRRSAKPFSVISGGTARAQAAPSRASSACAPARIQAAPDATLRRTGAAPPTATTPAATPSKGSLMPSKHTTTSRRPRTGFYPIRFRPATQPVRSHRPAHLAPLPASLASARQANSFATHYSCVSLEWGVGAPSQGRRASSRPRSRPRAKASTHVLN